MCGRTERSRAEMQRRLNDEQTPRNANAARQLSPCSAHTRTCADRNRKRPKRATINARERGHYATAFRAITSR
jgi:hypothetical protein